MMYTKILKALPFVGPLRGIAMNKLKKFILPFLCLFVFCIAGCSLPEMHPLKQRELWTPKQDIHLIIVHAPGSSSDVSARLLAREAEKVIGKKIIVENIVGDEGRKGWTALANAKPDGYTLGYITMPTYTTLALEKDSPFSAENILPIANHVLDTSVVVVRKDSRFQTLQQLAEYAEAHPKELKASTNGDRASNYGALQLLASTAGFTYTPIHLQNTPKQLEALHYGGVDFTCVKYSDIVTMINTEDAYFKVLGVFAEKRLKQLPEVPTLAEFGYYGKWYGAARAIVVPDHTPGIIIGFYEKAFRLAMIANKTIREHEGSGLQLYYLNSRNLDTLIKNETAFSRDVLLKLYESDSEEKPKDEARPKRNPLQNLQE